MGNNRLHKLTLMHVHNSRIIFLILKKDPSEKEKARKNCFEKQEKP